jgi:hypothetical protein
VHFTFNVPPPMNITNRFGRWLNGIDKKTKEQICVRGCALVWTIWNYRNKLVFNRCANTNILQVGYSQSGFFYSLVRIPSSSRPVETFGYWMQSPDGGC